MIHRRALITGLVSLISAPAIVRAGSLMPVKAVKFAGVYNDGVTLIAAAHPCGPFLGDIRSDISMNSLEIFDGERWRPAAELWREYRLETLAG